MSKVLEKVIANQLLIYLENNLIILSNLDFTKKCSTEMALCHFIERIKCLLDNGNVVGAVFLSLKKAFNTVSHDILVSKLKYQFIFSALVVSWFSSYLAYRQQCVQLQNVKTSLNRRAGLPQGSVLGPLLFCLHINDLRTIYTGTECQMYADDSVLCLSKESLSGFRDLKPLTAHSTVWLSSFSVTISQ